jgi:hypothetical protein
MINPFIVVALSIMYLQILYTMVIIKNTFESYNYVYSSSVWIFSYIWRVIFKDIYQSNDKLFYKIMLCIYIILCTLFKIKFKTCTILLILAIFYFTK